LTSSFADLFAENRASRFIGVRGVHRPFDTTVGNSMLPAVYLGEQTPMLSQISCRESQEQIIVWSLPSRSSVL